MEKIVELLFQERGPDLVFVEAEIGGRSIPFATWSERDGYRILRIRANPIDLPHPHVNGETAGKHMDCCAHCGLDLRNSVHSEEALRAVWNWPSSAAKPSESL